MPDLILGTIKNYSFSQIKPFLESLFDVGYSGQIVLFASGISHATASKLSKSGVKLINFSNHYPFLFGYDEILSGLGLPTQYDLPLSLCTERFVMYYLYLSRYGQEYNRVMLTDVRDVIFQKDPFGFVGSDHLCVFLEDGKYHISDCQYNSSWIKQSFGKEVYENIKDKNISCNGVIIGSVKPVLGYLKQKSDLIFRVGPPGIVGQGFHNYLVHTGRLLDMNIFTNETGPVLTLGLASEYNENGDGKLLNESGSVANIVHQYDRHPELARRYYDSMAVWRGRINDVEHWVISPLKSFPRFYFFLKTIYFRLWQK